VTWRYLVAQGYAAAGRLTIVALAAVNWRTIILATTTYSEMIFAALSVAGLFLAGDWARRTERIELARGLTMGWRF
jgi:hypothetical protein